MRAWPLLLALLLAGCSGKEGSSDGSSDGDDADPGPGDDGMEGGENRTFGEPVIHVVPVGFDGNLGTFAILCADGQCVPPDGATVAPDETDFLYEHPGAILVAVNLTLTWESTSAATDTLGLGAMRMGTNSTAIGSVEGTSPLAIQEDDLELPLDMENLFHAYVYNARGPVQQGPAHGYATVDEEFHVEGTLTFIVSGT